MNYTDLIDSWWYLSKLILQETRSIHDSMNIPKLDFLNEYSPNRTKDVSSVVVVFFLEKQILVSSFIILFTILFTIIRFIVDT